MSSMTPLAERSPNTASSPTKCSTLSKTASPTKSISTTTSKSSEDLQPIKSSSTTTAAATSGASEEEKEQQESQDSDSSRMPMQISEAQTQTYVSPSDNIMSPTTKKLSEIKGRRFANPNSKTQKSLFAKTVAKEGLRSQEKLDSMSK